MGIWNTVARHVKREMNTHARRSWHVRQHPMVQEDREKLKDYASLSGKVEKKGNLGTRVRFVNYGKTVLNDIAMLEGHNVVHAVSCEFFSVKFKKRSKPFLDKRRSLTLLFQTSPHGTRRTIGDPMSLWFLQPNGRMMRILYLLCRI